MIHYWCELQLIEPDWIKAGVIPDENGELAKLADDLVRDIEASRDPYNPLSTPPVRSIQPNPDTGTSGL